MDAEQFIAKWQPSGGNERANTQLFINDLCALLGVASPQPTLSDTLANDYVFERHVIKTEIDGTTSNGWIDCYKRDSFILEAKQGSGADIAAVEAGRGESLRDFFGQTAAERYKRGMAKRGTGQWTGAMQRAAGQAEGYAKALPNDWPPFLLITDVGYCIDVYADFQRSGKGYAPFPDRRRFRVTLDDLRDPDVRARLAAIWDTPMALDPSAEAARVTRGIADHLATLARRIEAREQNPDRTAAFLMRLLFTMFAEDTGLIAKKSFSDLLKRHRDEPDVLGHQLTELWTAMDRGGIAGSIGARVIQFNGWMFKDRTAIPLEVAEIDVLILAAEADWQQVEPAIFGTLLERALDAKERAKLGAHYTPRAYVERLVGPTIMEPLREDWIGVRAAATEAAEAGDKDGARKLVERFHGTLARTRVLDPACGTGNFLYVAMARMKELEGEVLELLQELGDDQYLAEISGHTITPENFLGIEINPRAAQIAQLVLWIGYLQWHFRVNGEDRMPPEPVLRDVKTIENRDALITWDRRELERDENGSPKTVWDGSSMRVNPVTGRLEADENAQKELYRYYGVKPSRWPAADFIVGNPPFIGNKKLRRRLGSGYVAAVRAAWPAVSNGADLVMYWWSIAADATAKRKVKRFGLVSTNSIKQISNRSVVSPYLSRKRVPISLAFAVPDHPWLDESTTAAVRIAMTVARPEIDDGILESVTSENKRPNGLPEVGLSQRRGRINSDLTIGVDVTIAKTLMANQNQSFMGVIPSGLGFRITLAELSRLGYTSTLPPVVREYLGGSDLTDNVAAGLIIDFFGISRADAETLYKPLFSFTLDTMKRERQTRSGVTADSQQYAEDWWLFAKPRPEMRAALKGLGRYIGTTETSKRRWFTFLPATTLPDQKIRVIASEDAYCLGILSSRFHVTWSDATGGRQGVGNDPVYNNTTCFEAFPFPDTSDEALKDRIRDAAEKLDTLRKEVLARHEDLTLTKLYNVLAALRAAEAAGTVLSDKDRDVATRGCVSLIRQYHDAIDAGVAEAYGWPADLSDDKILERLVALNTARVAEERRGDIKWLRPDFQKPGFVAPKEQTALALPEAAPRTAEVLAWPAALPDQFTAVAAVVDRAARPIAANDVARAFRGKNAKGVVPVLDTLAGMGRVRKLEDGRYAA